MANQNITIKENKVSTDEVLEETQNTRLTDEELKSKFTDNLEKLLKKAKIKKKVLAEYMGINPQTFYNWFGKENEVPNWIIQMYRLNVFLYKQKELNFNPLMLFNNKFQQLQTQQIQSFKEVKKTNRDYMDKILKNTTLYFGRSRDGKIDFRLLFSNSNLFNILYYIKKNYCDLPANERNKGIGEKSVTKLKDLLFDFITDFIINHRNENGKYRYLLDDDLLNYMYLHSNT